MAGSGWMVFKAKDISFNAVNGIFSIFYGIEMNTNKKVSIDGIGKIRTILESNELVVVSSEGNLIADLLEFIHEAGTDVEGKIFFLYVVGRVAGSFVVTAMTWVNNDVKEFWGHGVVARSYDWGDGI